VITIRDKVIIAGYHFFKKLEEASLMLSKVNIFFWFVNSVFGNNYPFSNPTV